MKNFALTAALAFLAFTAGQGEAVARDTRRNVNFAGSDPRSDGEAIPQEPPTQ